MERLDAHPEMHVYHYGGYESGAIKRLMQRHATCVDEVDRLLRGDVLVDLLNVVRQGVRASVESYSLKQIEKFYMPAREGPVTEAGFSVVAFETWLKERDQAILDGIAAYNRDDCVSTWMLRTWLEGHRADAVLRWPELDVGPPGGSGHGPVGGRDRVAPTRRGAGPRAHRRSRSRGRRAPEAEARRLLADLLDWHRREEKSQWWRWFELKDDLTVEELVAERDALSGLAFVDERTGDGVMVHRRYRFEPQDHGFDPGDQPLDRDTGKSAGTIVAIDDTGGTIELRRVENAEWPHPVALIPTRRSRATATRGTPAGRGRRDRATGSTATVRIRRSATCCCACRRGAAPGRPGLVEPDEAPLQAARRLALELEDGVLPIQGPPGTGKTYAAARMIVDLVAGRQDSRDHRAVAQDHQQPPRGGRCRGCRGRRAGPGHPEGR